MRGYYQRVVDMLDLDRMGERLPGAPAASFLSRHGKRIKRTLVGGFVLLAAFGAFLFAGDYVVLRYRVAAGTGAFSKLTVRPYYAVRLKSASHLLRDYLARVAVCCGPLAACSRN